MWSALSYATGGYFGTTEEVDVEKEKQELQQKENESFDELKRLIKTEQPEWLQSLSDSDIRR